MCPRPVSISRLFFYEETISTFEDTAEASARLPEPQLKQKRQRRAPQSQARGTQALNSRITEKARMGASRDISRGLGAALRIKRSGHFALIKKEGRRMSQGCLAANWKETEPGCRSRLGLVTSKRIGSAVARNRARRLLRESFRLHRSALARPVDLVLVARPSISGLSFGEVDRDLVLVLSRAGLLRSQEPGQTEPAS